MYITDIKLDADSGMIAIKYGKETSTGLYNECTIKSEERPKPEFGKEWNKVGTMMTRIMTAGLNEKEQAILGNVMGIEVKRLQFTKTERHYDGDKPIDVPRQVRVVGRILFGDIGLNYTSNTIDLTDEEGETILPLIKEAEAYIIGDRSQDILFNVAQEGDITYPTEGGYNEKEMPRVS